MGDNKQLDDWRHCKAWIHRVVEKKDIQSIDRKVLEKINDVEIDFVSIYLYSF